MLSGVIVKFFSLQVLMDHAGAALCRRSVRVFLAPLLFCFWPHAASAEHLCAERNNEYTVREVYDQTGNIIEYWCEWGDEGDAGAAAMRYFSPEEWKSFAEHGANVETQDARRRIQAGRRYRQLQDGLWFMPGEIPFAGWSSGASGSTLGSGAIRAGEDCTVSYWTPTGAVIMSTLGGKNDNAVISYMSYSIPISNENCPKSRVFDGRVVLSWNWTPCESEHRSRAWRRDQISNHPKIISRMVGASARYRSAVGDDEDDACARPASHCRRDAIDQLACRFAIAAGSEGIGCIDHTVHGVTGRAVDGVPALSFP